MSIYDYLLMIATVIVGGLILKAAIDTIRGTMLARKRYKLRVKLRGLKEYQRTLNGEEIRSEIGFLVNREIRRVTVQLKGIDLK